MRGGNGERGLRDLLLRGSLLVLLLLMMKLLTGLAGELRMGYQASLAFGFLILGGFLAGQATRSLGLPAITGYLVAGILCGPHLLNVLPFAVVETLRPIDRLALFFIALTAGAELDADMLRRQWRTVAAIGFSQLLLGGGIVLLVLLALAPWLPLYNQLDGLALLAAATLLAVVTTAKSPATTVAVIIETGARGPMRDLALAVTVLMDVLVIIAFTLVLGWAGTVLGGSGHYSLLKELGALSLSLLLGLLFGRLLLLMLAHLEKMVPFVLLLAALLIVQACRDLHLDALMLAVAAGFVVANNPQRKGQRFLYELEGVAQPVFLVFFGIAGAQLDLPLLLQIGFLTLFVVALRMLAKWASVGLAAKASALPRVVGQHLWMSFLGQAGVSLGFAALIAREVPGIGNGLREIIVAAVVLNQVLGPVLFKVALHRAGEIPRDGNGLK